MRKYFYSLTTYIQLDAHGSSESGAKIVSLPRSPKLMLRLHMMTTSGAASVVINAAYRAGYSLAPLDGSSYLWNMKSVGFQ